MKQGDKCRIIGKKANHGFEISDEVEVLIVPEKYKYAYVLGPYNQKYCVDFEDLEIIESAPVNPLVEIFERNSTNGQMDIKQFIDAMREIKDSNE
jgi:hypothetical protein